MNNDNNDENSLQFLAVKWTNDSQMKWHDIPSNQRHKKDYHLTFIQNTLLIFFWDGST